MTHELPNHGWLNYGGNGFAGSLESRGFNFCGFVCVLFINNIFFTIFHNNDMCFFSSRWARLWGREILICPVYGGLPGLSLFNCLYLSVSLSLTQLLALPFLSFLSLTFSTSSSLLLLLYRNFSFSSLSSYVVFFFTLNFLTLSSSSLSFFYIFFTLLFLFQSFLSLCFHSSHLDSFYACTILIFLVFIFSL